jgi:hypothetical protein
LKSTEYYRKLALKQWDFAAVIALLIAVVVIWKVATSLGGDVYSGVKNVYCNMRMLKSADSIAALPELTRIKADKIDSCIKVASSVQMISEQAIPGMIYTLANQAGIKASKVEISGKIAAEQGSQIPVSFKGEGDYAGCGKFMDGVEHMQPAGRIRELNMKSSGINRIDLFVDFVLMEQK